MRSKCIIVSGTRVCDPEVIKRVDSTTNGEDHLKFDEGVPADIAGIAEALRKLEGDPDQIDLAVRLLRVVFAKPWTNKNKQQNSTDIVESVRFFLRDDIPHLDGHFTLVSY